MVHDCGHSRYSILDRHGHPRIGCRLELSTLIGFLKKSFLKISPKARLVPGLLHFSHSPLLLPSPPARQVNFSALHPPTNPSPLPTSPPKRGIFCPIPPKKTTKNLHFSLFPRPSPEPSRKKITEILKKSKENFNKSKENLKKITGNFNKITGSLKKITGKFHRDAHQISPKPNLLEKSLRKRQPRWAARFYKVKIRRNFQPVKCHLNAFTFPFSATFFPFHPSSVPQARLPAAQP